MGQSWTAKVRRVGILCAVNLSLYLNCFAGVDQGEKKVTLNVVEESCVKVFKQIEKQTKMSFFYSTSDIRLPGKVSINVVDAALDEVMGRILEGTNLEWIYTDNVITIRKKKGLVGGGNGMGLVADSNINMITVTGKVTQADGTGIPGATVRIKRNNDGTTTDNEGNFILPNTRKADRILISSIGYETREIAVAGNSILIKLNVAVSDLDATVIKGYYTTTKRLNTGSVSTIKNDVISSQPVGNPIDALSGRVPGLNITSFGGLPGSNHQVRLRGQNSFTNGNNPLYIIDGVPFTSTSLTNPTVGAGALPNSSMSPFNSLNISDIESIDVLKDADATAIYGSRGANGVIIITTKKAKYSKANFNIDLYKGIGKVSHFMDLLNTQQYLKMRREAFLNDGATPTSRSYDLNGTWDTTRYTDWQKVFLGNESKITDIQTALNWGNESTQVLISGGYRKETTVFDGDFSDIKSSLRTNISHTNSNKKLQLNLSAIFVNDNLNLPSDDITPKILLAPNAPQLYDQVGKLNWEQHSGVSTWVNPLAPILKESKANTKNLLSSLNLTYEILNGLRIKINGGYNFILLSQSLKTPGTSVDPSISDIASARNITVGDTKTTTWILEPQLNYIRKIGQGTLNLLIGSTFQENDYKTESVYAANFPTDELLDNLGAASVVSALTNNGLYRYSAIFGRISYDWQEKYLLNITARRDGSSRFGKNKQYGNFGALGIGWIFSDEEFTKQLTPFLSFGKIRASLGTTGNDQIGDYQYLSTYSSIGYNYQGLSGLYPTSLTNPDYGWEKVNKLEFGLDLGFLRDKVLLNLSYYRNTSKNQLIGYPLPTITGYTSVQANMPAVIKNRGWEVQITSQNLTSKHFTWITDFNIGISKNTLASYPNIESSSYSNTQIIGRSLYDTKAYHYIKVDPQTGIYIFATKNSDGQPSYPTDLISVRKLGPEFQGGLQNSLAYKNFKVDIFLQFVKRRGPSFLTLFSRPGSFGRTPNQHVKVLNNWKNPGDVSEIQKYSQNFAEAYTAWVNKFSENSDANSEDNSYMRLKNICISYDIPIKTWKRKIFIDRLRLFTQCQNLFTITKYKGLDPETQSLALPPLRIVTFGGNISF